MDGGEEVQQREMGEWSGVARLSRFKRVKRRVSLRKTLWTKTKTMDDWGHAIAPQPLERLACWCVHCVCRRLKIIGNVSLQLSLMSNRKPAQSKRWAVQFSELFISRLNGAAVTKISSRSIIGMLLCMRSM